jgi:hypothetical protein
MCEFKVHVRVIHAAERGGGARVWTMAESAQGYGTGGRCSVTPFVLNDSAERCGLGL